MRWVVFAALLLGCAKDRTGQVCVEQKTSYTTVCHKVGVSSICNTFPLTSCACWRWVDGINTECVE